MVATGLICSEVGTDSSVATTNAGALTGSTTSGGLSATGAGGMIDAATAMAMPAPIPPPQNVNRKIWKIELVTRRWIMRHCAIHCGAHVPFGPDLRQCPWRLAYPHRVVFPTVASLTDGVHMAICPQGYVRFEQYPTAATAMVGATFGHLGVVGLRNSSSSRRRAMRRRNSSLSRVDCSRMMPCAGHVASHGLLSVI